MFKFIKIIFIIGIFFILSTLAAIFIFINSFDLDKYRKNITKAINRNIEGRVELGKISTSWMKGLDIQVAGFALFAKEEETPLLSNDLAELKLSWISILKLNPKVSLKFRGANVRLVKFKDGTFNFSKLLKKTSIKTTSSSSSSSSKDNDIEALEAAILLAFLFTVLDIEEGNFSYQDELSGQSFAIKNWKLLSDSILFEEESAFTLRLPVSGKTEDLSFDGALNVKGLAQLTTYSDNKNKESSSLKLDLKVDADELRFEYAEKLFYKDASVPMSATIKLKTEDEKILLEDIALNLRKIALHMKGVIEPENENKVKLRLSSKSLELAELKNFFDFMSPYTLLGKLDFRMDIKGNLEKPIIKGTLNVKKAKIANKEFLKEDIRFSLNSKFSNTGIEVKKLELLSSSSNFLVQGNFKGLFDENTEKIANVNISSKVLNLDEILQKEEKKTAWLQNWNFLIPTAHANMGDATWELFSNIKYLQDVKASIKLSLKKLIFNSLSLKKLQASSHLKFPYLYLDQASFSTFGGQWKLSSRLNLEDASLPYRSNGKVRNLDLNSFVSYYFPVSKDSFLGSSHVNWNLSGLFFPIEKRKDSVNGYANLSIQNGVLRKVSFSNMLDSLLEKSPILTSKEISLNLDEGFRSFSARAEFKKSKIQLKKIKILGRKRGFNATGKSTIESNGEQETYLSLYNPNDILPLSIAGRKENPLALRLFGPLTKPRLDYSYSISRLAKRKLKSSVKVIEQKGKKKVGDILKKIGISQ